MAMAMPPPSTARATRGMVLVCYGDSKRRHQRRRNWGDNGGKKLQQLQQHDEDDQGRLSINVEDLGRGAKDALHRVATNVVDEWRSTFSWSRESGLVVSFRRSSLEYAGLGAVCILLLALVGKAVVSVARRSGWGWGAQPKMVVRRDRSLGGKEVVVAVGSTKGPAVKLAPKPLMPLDDSIPSEQQHLTRAERRRRIKHHEKQVPQWWLSTQPSSSPDSYAQAEVTALVRVIVEKRLAGVDFLEEDILLLRQICRHSGAKADFGTENTRDSFYRAAVAFVLSACSRDRVPTSEIEYGGESMVSFVCGLAANINLDPARAASIINAAVAARTRAGFLQAWADTAQGKIVEADEEIKQLACMHHVFPSEPNSPYIEMVARGLEAHLAVDEREALLQMYSNVAADHTKRIAAEALALPSTYVS